MTYAEEAISFAKENQPITSFVHQIPANELIDNYWHANKIKFSPYLGLGGAAPTPYRDKGTNYLYSDTIAAFLLGLPFPNPIVAEDLGGERFSIVSGEQAMSTIIHYLGGMPNIRRTLSDDVNIFPGLSDIEFGKLSADQKTRILDGVLVNINMLDPHKPAIIDSECITKFYGPYKN